ncbi:MAG: putative metallo-hydrolase YycJ [Pelotomaculum sp. PtaB.Bin104]|nr:MAG: putative metallo-hydrolase YycJ [Pelotomaculum sp. PtaB.Bin104]
MIEIKCFASGSSGNCYLVTDGETLLLLEAGIHWRLIRQHINFQTGMIAGVLISHEHQDHAKAVKDAIKSGLDIYASEGTLKAICATGHRVNPVTALKQFKLGSWTVLPFETQHDAAAPFGFLLANQAGEKLLYATDTYYIRYMFPGLTHIMIECNYSIDSLRVNVEAGLVPKALKDRLLSSHLSLEHMKEFLKANDLARVQEIWLIHLSGDNSDAERFKREIQALTGKPVFIAG